jgi:hypothetical protein
MRTNKQCNNISGSRGCIMNEIFAIIITVTLNKNISVFRDITLGSLLKVNRHSRGTCRFHFHAGFLFNLFFDTEDGGDNFLRNVG